MELATASVFMRPTSVNSDALATVSTLGTGPDALAAARFSELMRLDAAPTVQVPVEVLSNAAIQTPIAPVAGASIGDRILSGMQGLSSDVQGSWTAVKNALDNGSNMTTADMLKLQMGLTQMSIQYDLVGKAISRSTQNLDQLLKMQ